jgi:sugar phosphate isomerase/epimerase
VPFQALPKVIGDIGYKGWIDLETSGRSKSIEDDMKKNLAYLRVLLAS